MSVPDFGGGGKGIQWVGSWMAPSIHIATRITPSGE
jgi:hypothetical protein